MSVLTIALILGYSTFVVSLSLEHDVTSMGSRGLQAHEFTQSLHSVRTGRPALSLFAKLAVLLET
jgi:hypothetical protein